MKNRKRPQAPLILLPLSLLWLSVVSPSLLVGASPENRAADPFTALNDAIMLHRAPDGRLYGENEPAPLLLFRSPRLLEGESYRLFKDALDAFSALSQEEMDRYSPVQRALLQHHLWVVFDWCASRYFMNNATAEIDTRRREIQTRVAPLMRRLALSQAEIDALPNPLAATIESGVFAPEHDPSDPKKPFLPPGIRSGDERSDWVCLRSETDIVAADMHTEIEEWRTAFIVLMRLPGGKKATTDYLAKLGKFREPWAFNGHYYFPNPKTPQFPIGTQVALVHRALLINRDGDIVLSPLVLGIQLRAFLSVERPREAPSPLLQAVAEFVIQPPQLMTGQQPVLRAIGAKEHHLSSVIDQGATFAALLKQTQKEVEIVPASQRSPRPHLQNCRTCHSSPGIHSLNTRVKSFSSKKPLEPPVFIPGMVDSIGEATARKKKNHYSWGLLEGLWRAESL